MPTLHYKNKRTPKIKELSDERYVKVNSIINLEGEFYTDVYGNLQGVWKEVMLDVNILNTRKETRKGISVGTGTKWL